MKYLYLNEDDGSTSEINKMCTRQTWKENQSEANYSQTSLEHYRKQQGISHRKATGLCNGNLDHLTLGPCVFRTISLWDLLAEAI